MLLMVRCQDRMTWPQVDILQCARQQVLGNDEGTLGTYLLGQPLFGISQRRALAQQNQTWPAFTRQ